MDNSAQRRIDEINASIPEHLKKNVTRFEDDVELLEQKERAEHMLRKLNSGLGATTGKISGEQREKLEKHLKNFLNNTDFTKKVEKENPHVQKQIGQYIDEQLKKEFKSGRLNPASKRDVDDFMRKMTRK